ncbi:Hpt domain-containing protein [Ferrimonas lipolytica]|uniref:Histidine kinase n=1 Tax=Ferrimonas lipolytica TaxID=2724191 RepID=A0A6H1U8U1_9GAMM|nr:Hpt domain-containing protein [Ferrimonas lipolytica]QIZ75444.1 histidine kinase [Ferrimonas lipolytica]
MALSQYEQLDTVILDQYCDAIGAELLMKSVVMFEEMGPQYIGAVATAINADKKEAIISEAHKLKGAAGSIGLKRIQQLSERIQCGDEPEWESQFSEWFAQINLHYDADVSLLKQYLAGKS